MPAQNLSSRIFFILSILIAAAIMFVNANIAIGQANMLTATLGNYPNTSVALSSDATITPDAVPTNTTSISAETATGFVGELTADPATGVVRVTNAHYANIAPGA